MPPKPRYNPEVIGAELLEARERGVSWKELSRRYDLGKTRLYMLWKDAEADHKNVHERPDSGQRRPALG